jgi:uncharacterized membrane protein (UPF0136 family)
MTNSAIVLWVYVVLLLAGGLMGHLKAGSKISLALSAVFALLLALCLLRVLPVPWLPQILLGVLLAVFAMRLAKTGKFMPSGLMLSLTAVTLLCYLWLQ